MIASRSNDCLGPMIASRSLIGPQQAARGHPHVHPSVASLCRAYSESLLRRLEAYGIDAISQRLSIVEHVPEVRAACLAPHLFVRAPRSGALSSQSLNQLFKTSGLLSNGCGPDLLDRECRPSLGVCVQIASCALARADARVREEEAQATRVGWKPPACLVFLTSVLVMPMDLSERCRTAPSNGL